MPAVKQNIAVQPGIRSILAINLASVLSSIELVYSGPTQGLMSDDWKWVLRTASSSRPVLQLRDGTVVIANSSPNENDDQPRMSVQLSNASVRPGSSSALPGYLGTAVSYDQSKSFTVKATALPPELVS